jgi:hypothetical protein
MKALLLCVVLLVGCGGQTFDAFPAGSVSDAAPREAAVPLEAAPAESADAGPDVVPEPDVVPPEQHPDVDPGAPDGRPVKLGPIDKGDGGLPEAAPIASEPVPEAAPACVPSPTCQAWVGEYRSTRWADPACSVPLLQIPARFPNGAIVCEIDDSGLDASKGIEAAWWAVPGFAASRWWSSAAGDCRTVVGAPAPDAGFVLAIAQTSIPVVGCP